MNRRASVVLLAVVAVVAPLAGCTTAQQCQARGGTWVRTWDPAHHYDGQTRRWVGGWDEGCKDPAPPPARGAHRARTRPARKGGQR